MDGNVDIDQLALTKFGIGQAIETPLACTPLSIRPRTRLPPLPLVRAGKVPPIPIETRSADQVSAALSEERGKGAGSGGATPLLVPLNLFVLRRPILHDGVCQLSLARSGQTGQPRPPDHARAQGRRRHAALFRAPGPRPALSRGLRSPLPA